MTIKRKLTGRKSKIALPAGLTDCQIHIYDTRFSAHPNGPAIPEGCPNISDYRHVADWLGIDRSVVTVANAHQADNRSLLAIMADFGKNFRGIASLHNGLNAGEIDSLQHAGIVGARIMDLPGGAIPFSSLYEIDNITAPRGMMIAVQFNGNGFLEKWSTLKGVKSRYVIDHHGKFFNAIKPDGKEVDQLKLLIDQGNCWFKFAGCYESSTSGPPDYEDVGQIARVIAKYAPDRIIWGTNWPQNASTSTEDYPDDMELLEVALSWVDSKHHQKVLVSNPEELFGFPKWNGHKIN